MPDRGVPVAILPLGSANNIARSFGVAGAPYELAEILHPLYWQRLQHGHRARSLGPAPLRRGGGPGAARAHDEDAVARRGAGRRQSARRPSTSFARSCRKAKPLDIDVRVDGKPLPGDILAIEIMNIVYTGPGLPLAPSADPGDRMLEVVCVAARPTGAR